MKYKSLTEDENQLLSPEQKRALADFDSKAYKSEGRWRERVAVSVGLSAELDRYTTPTKFMQRTGSQRVQSVYNVDRLLADYDNLTPERFEGRLDRVEQSIILSDRQAKVLDRQLSVRKKPHIVLSLSTIETLKVWYKGSYQNGYTWSLKNRGRGRELTPRGEENRVPTP